MIEKIKSWFKKVFFEYDYNACYREMETKGRAAFGICSGKLKTDNEQDTNHADECDHCEHNAF